MGNRVDGQTQINFVLIPAGVFVLRFAGTCAVFYLFFLCRMIGAGDIKLMGLIVGFSGLWDGIFILGLGFVIAAVSAACRMTRQGTVWPRLERIARFAVESGINGKITEYPGYFEKESLMRLGPYLFAGLLSVSADPIAGRTASLEGWEPVLSIICRVCSGRGKEKV